MEEIQVITESSKIPIEVWTGFIGVFVGSLIPAVANIVNNILNGRNNKELKRIEIKHQAKLQSSKEKNDREMRLLNEKIEAFTDFYKLYGAIFHSGTDKECVKRTLELNSALIKLELLTPRLRNDLNKLQDKVVDISNVWLKSLQDDSYTAKKREKDKERILKTIRPLGKKIRKALPAEL